MTPAALKPCPWCKEAPSQQHFDGWYYTGCYNMDCPVQPVILGEATQSEADEKWNNRQE
jgi:hypothetical protein